MRQQILDDTHSLVSAATVTRKICEAIRFHRDKGWWFAERELRFHFSPPKDSYAPGEELPAGIAEIVGRHLWVLIGGSENSRQRIDRCDNTTFEFNASVGLSPSQPYLWNFFGNRLRFYPAPISSADVVVGKYVADIGVPVVKWDSGSSSYKFYLPDQSAEISDDFTNDWFTQDGAGDMIRARATYLLQAESLKDADAAQTALQLWLEMVGQLETDSEQRTAGDGRIRPVLLDNSDMGWW